MKMSTKEVRAFFDDNFGQAVDYGVRVEEVTETGARFRLVVGEAHLRPGNTVSGPAMTMLADAAMYGVLLSQIGPVALAVTTSLSMDFLRRPGSGDLLADAELLKLGRRLAVGRVVLRRPDREEPVAHATLTYSIPPDASPA